MSSQRSTGATQRVPDQRSTGATPRTSDQRSTGATPRISDQRSTGATPRISDQRSTGATPVYEDISTTGTFRSLIGRTPEGGAKTAGEQSEQDSDEAAPERSRKSLTATIEVEAQKSKVNFFEKLITRHPIIVGTVAFCVLVLPVYAVIVNSQSPAARAEYKQTLSKDLKIMASKLGKPGEYKGHKVAFYANRADAYMKSAEYQLAIGDLKIARLIDPAKSGTYNAKLSDCYIAVKDYKNAVAASAEIIKSDQSDVDALLQHAKSSYLLGNTLTALEDYFKAVKLDPSNPEVFIARGDYYLSEKKLGSAAADYKHALELAPSLAEAKRKLAASTLVVRRTASVDSAEVTAKLSPAALKMIGEADLATLKAKGYEALKKSDNLFAIAALSRAVSLAPNDALVRQYLAYAFLANENFADAVTQFNAWDKIATLKLPEKLAFARRLPAGSESCAAFYEQLIKQNSKDVQDLITIANACKLNGCQTQFEEAVDAGIKVGTPAEVAQLNTMKVAKAAEAKAAATAAKGTIAN
jgi:tetratricopeptide (TPR) repeat protein